MGQKSQLWLDLPAIESLNLNKNIYEIDDKDYQFTVDELAELLDVRDLLKIGKAAFSRGKSIP